MKTNKYLSIVAVGMMSLAVISFAFKKSGTNFILDEPYGPFVEAGDKEKESISIKLKIGNEIETLDLEEYVIGVVAGEMPASFEKEALKAQAVASRSYALYRKSKSSNTYDLTGDTNSQVYINEEQMKNKWGGDYQFYRDKIETAVHDTAGQVLSYDGKIIEAFYFAMSSGNTNESASVFGEARDYLQSVVSEYDNGSLNGFTSNVSFTIQDFKAKLGVECDSPTVENITRTSTNYVDKIVVCSKEFKGTQFRTLLGLRSTDFDIEIEDKVYITTRGYGHGVGMSQYGANGYASAGYSYEDILHHYYTDVEIIDVSDV